MITRQQTLDYVNKRTTNKNLVKHMLAVEAQMRALAKHFGENEDDWGLAGLIHDADYQEMQAKLYCGDELSGLIIACALVRPSKKLAEVTLESIKKKWPQKAFAAGVNREQTELCEAKLRIKLDEFIQICLNALQGINQELGL